MISVFLNLLRLILCPNMWSSWRLFCVYSDNVYSVAVGWNVLYMPVRSTRSKVFKSNMSLFISCLNDLSIVDSWILKPLLLL
jgi:hypothetical protein